MKTRYKLIACGVLKKEIAAVSQEIPEDIEIVEVFFEQGLHRDPDRLNTLIMQEIGLTGARDEDIDAILLGYGICSRGTIGVHSSRYPVVIPRAHDCITLFLGSKERYLREFSRAPGTYWFTPGFISGSVQPGMSEKYAGVYQEFEERYEEYLRRFGDKDLARYIIDRQEQAWIKNYSRGAYVESGLPGGQGIKSKARAFCEARNWCFEEVEGDLGLLKDLLVGNWDEKRFLVIEPGERVVPGSVDEVVTSHSTESEKGFIREDYTASFIYDGGYREITPDTENMKNNGADIVIGIDAGGTYTDAVVISLRTKSVMASAKSETTHHDLSLGIKKALTKLPPELLEHSSRLAISTTLATNAIVEEKGARTGLILIGYNAGTAALVNAGVRDIKASVAGHHDIYGVEKVPLDKHALIKTAESMIDRGVEALAVSSYMATRNPGHEIQAAGLLKNRFSVPVVSGHELTDDIDSVRRAHTVLLNARLLPVIGMLVRSVERVVREMGLPGDIRFVTTDGTLMNAAEALEQPVRLVLSGPAASVKGVRFLTDIDSCVLIDMGGTTSDIAVIENGSSKRTGRGAFVGKFKTSIKATDIRTIGLGGDSGISWAGGNVRVGPERVVPVSVAAANHPEVKSQLESLKGYECSDYGLVQPGTLYMLVRHPDNTDFLSDRERAVIELLSDGPLSVVTIAERLVYPYLSILGTGRLEELGYIRKCGLTPTDLLVAAKKLDMGDREAAGKMIELYSERSGLNAEAFIDRAWEEIHRMAAYSIITEVLAGGESGRTFPGCLFCESAFNGSSPVDVSYRLKHPLVGVGAPAHLMLDGIDELLRCSSVFPAHAEVANAVGAAAGTGGMHLDMTIMPDERGRCVLYSPEGMHIFRDCGEAKHRAIALARDSALAYAVMMGYESFSLDIHVRDRSAPTAFDTDLYIDTSIVATMKY